VGARGHGNLQGGAAAFLMNTMAGPGGGGGAMEGPGPDRAQVTGRNGRESLGRKVYLWTGMEGFWVSDKFRIIAEIWN
jgi:hypothetical protein